MESGETLQKAPGERLWTPYFTYICLANLFLFTSYQMLMPVLPLYVKNLGGSDVLAGVAVGIFYITAIGIRPWVGNQLDTKGRRKLLVVAFSLLVLVTLLYNLTFWLVILVVLRMIHGLVYGIANTTSSTVVFDLVPIRRRGEGVGFYGLFLNLGVGLGPVIAFLMLQRFSFAALFYTAALFAFLALLSVLPIRYPEERRQLDRSHMNIREMLYNQEALGPSLVMMCMTVTIGGVVTFLPLYAMELGFSQIWLFFLVYAVVLTLSRPLGGVLFDRLGYRKIMPTALVCSGLSMALLALTHQFGVILLAGFLFSFGYGVAHPALQTWCINRADHARKGSANGTFFAAFDLGICIGSILLGVVAHFTNYPMVFFLCLLSVLAGSVLYFMLVRQESAVKGKHGFRA